MPEQQSLTKEQVMEFLKKWVTAYEESKEEFFDFFAKDATFFTISSPTRIDGLEEFRRGFADSFAAQASRRSQILSPEIRVLGSTAVTSYHNRVLVAGSTTNMRATVVVSLTEDGDLKIVHLHNSPLGAPSVPRPARPLEEITLLEERVATAAATVGTPK